MHSRKLLTGTISARKVLIILKSGKSPTNVMREPGLNEAIRAAGGVSQLARRLGISQPSVSNWERVPAERLAAVEEATGIDRAQLRPDLFAARGPGETIDETDAARAREYALLATLLARAPDRDLLARLARLKGDASPLGLAHTTLAEAAGAADVTRVGREFFDLFVGIGRGEVMPYGSYYLTGFLHERPLARLRGDLADLGIARADGQCEPEDHVAILCEVMAGLADGRFDAPPGADQRLFERHLAPWAPRFFVDLERAEAADFYRSVGALGRTFFEIETEAFGLPS
jgi:TorA maturation chaperone TorD